MYEDILFPTDGSQRATDAARYAYRQAECFDATLHVLHVIDEKEATAIIGQGWKQSTQLAEESQGITQQIVSDGADQGLEIVEETRRGAPSREILRYVDETGIDLLIMSTTGKSGINRLLRGSTTEKVLRRSDVPVLAIPT